MGSFTVGGNYGDPKLPTRNVAVGDLHGDKVSPRLAYRSELHLQLNLALQFTARTASTTRAFLYVPRNVCQGGGICLQWCGFLPFPFLPT